MTTRVIAFGQAAAGDDGVGLVVLEALRALPLPTGVELRALRDATALVEVSRGAKRLIVVDALVEDIPIGTVRMVRPDELETATLSSVSSHGVGVGQALALASLLAPDGAREVFVVAIGIERPLAYGRSLSPAVREAVPHAVEAVRALIGG